VSPDTAHVQRKGGKVVTNIRALIIGAALLFSATGTVRAGQEDFFWVKDWSPRTIVIVCACGAVHSEASLRQQVSTSADTRTIAAAPNY
jgi:hypothetical protein